ncbi:hypothetical protein KRMM14A1259_02580 [Krasilnikovia sp. MM14-A1259]
MAWWLRTDGYAVVTAGSAETALDVVGRYGMPQAAVLDIGLPGHDGIYLLNLLRHREPRLPAVFSTALTHVSDVSRMKAADTKYLLKPYRATTLRRAVQELLT